MTNKTNKLSVVIGFKQTDLEYACLSNFYHSTFEYAGTHFNAAEQFIMYHKVLLFNRFDLAEMIIDQKDPHECKKIARRPFPEFNSALWDKTCITIVKRALTAKFIQNPDMLEVLLSTGDALLFGLDTHDNKWSIGIEPNGKDEYDVSKWKGSNLLGRVMMIVREELRNELARSQTRTLTFEDARDLDPIPEWLMKVCELKRIPQFYDTVHAYQDTLRQDAREALNEWPLHAVENAMRENMGGGLPITGFFELKQDVYDIARRLRY